ncbi:hypothetical protein FRUB_08392 [Fimbriiglobus ruber]|uniref:Uncharacterized protein n=1 Tax=Fimbriiglobus ruber TaxID=1908690 RepID=A0A225DFA9_9BACT|nr:hypothetical protein FRUB_08392 [Fimbriiglobus ruber]
MSVRQALLLFFVREHAGEFHRNPKKAHEVDWRNSTAP